MARAWPAIFILPRTSAGLALLARLGLACGRRCRWSSGFPATVVGGGLSRIRTAGVVAFCARLIRRGRCILAGLTRLARLRRDGGTGVAARIRSHAQLFE